ncbi:hypothetical protein HaLaN_04091, partial [Haematococcus lacustris]
MRLHGAQEMVLERNFKKLEEEAASVSLQEWGTRKQLVVFFGNAGIGTRGGWGAKAVLQACRKPCEEELDSSKPTRPEDWKPKPGQVQNRLLRSAWSKRWPDQGRLPAQGKEYPALGFKKLRDQAPKAQAQQPVAQ